jgi:xanthine dehydrogenase small subunit
MPTLPAPRPIRFVHRGQVMELHGSAITRSTLDWLREDARCTGTKEGCNEGDCGACTVVVAELEDETPATSAGALASGDAVGAAHGLRLRAVNACLRMLPTLDGKALLTVEDVTSIGQAAGAPLHPVQQAMVACHGSQCGFCTPGFVMSLFARYETQLAAGGQGVSRAQLADDLAGNLCRCTGYRPILEAGQQMMALPPARVDAAALRAQLLALRERNGSATFVHEAPNVAMGGRTDRFFAPRTLADLAWLRKAQPHARLLAGATDIGLWVNKQFRDLGDVIYVGEVAELRRIGASAGKVSIGAAATLEDAWAALSRHWPSLQSLWRRFAGPPTRHAGTMGGNVANGSPIGDSAPVLMALGASLLLRRGRSQRRVALQDFYLGYLANALAGGEFVQAIEVPLPSTEARRQQSVRAYKNSKRFDCDISALCAAFCIEQQDGVVVQARLAFGGMAATVKRAAQAESRLLGRAFNEASVRDAMASLARDFQPLDDLRASAAYRMQVAQALWWRFWLETRPQQPLRADQLDVFEATAGVG